MLIHDRDSECGLWSHLARLMLLAALLEPKLREQKSVTSTVSGEWDLKRGRTLQLNVVVSLLLISFLFIDLLRSQCNQLQCYYSSTP